MSICGGKEKRGKRRSALFGAWQAKNERLFSVFGHRSGWDLQVGSYDTWFVSPCHVGAMRSRFGEGFGVVLWERSSKLLVIS
jgi:hypothetical protein